MNKDKKHILFLPRWYPNNEDIQLGIFFQEQAKLLSKNYKITVIYVQNDESLNQNYFVEHENNNGFDLYRIYFNKHKIFGRLSHLNRYFKAQKIAYKKIDNKIDLVHVHVPIRPTLLALFLYRKENIPFIISEHWSGHLTGEFQAKNIIYKSIYKYVLSRAIKVTTVSQFLQSQFKKNTGKNSIVIPNYIQASNISNSKKESDTINILSISDFNNTTKNINGLLIGFDKAIKENSDLKLTIIGDGPDKNEILNLINHLNIPDNKINLLGRLSHEEVLKQIPKCDFYISNSNFETFGMSIAEALIHGKPVISTTSGGPNEFINEANGLLIPSNNEKELVKSILKMAETFSLYQSEKIKEEIESKYGKLKIIEDWSRIYDSI